MRKKAAGKLALRAERRLDIPVIHQVVELGRAAEANLVDALRRGGGLSLSAVTTFDGRVIGSRRLQSRHHRCRGQGDTRTRVGAGGGGSGVSRARHRHTTHWLGVGGVSAHGTSPDRGAGAPPALSSVWFQDAESCGILSPFPVPPEVFMVLELVSGATKGCSGQVRYRPELSQ